MNKPFSKELRAAPARNRGSSVSEATAGHALLCQAGLGAELVLHLASGPPRSVLGLCLSWPTSQQCPPACPWAAPRNSQSSCYPCSLAETRSPPSTRTSRLVATLIRVFLSLAEKLPEKREKPAGTQLPPIISHGNPQGAWSAGRSRLLPLQPEPRLAGGAAAQGGGARGSASAGAAAILGRAGIREGLSASAFPAVPRVAVPGPRPVRVSGWSRAASPGVAAAGAG